jgi:SLT domain-containing protein
MQNYNKEQALNTAATDSSGSAQAKYQTYLQSTEAKMNTLITTVHTMYSEIIDSSAINTGVTMLTKLLSGIGSVVQSIGLVPAALMTVATTLSIVSEKWSLLTLSMDKEKGFQVTGLLSNGVKGLKSAYDSYETSYAKYIEQITLAKGEESAMPGRLTQMKASVLALADSEVGATLATAALSVATIALNAVIGMGIGMAISAAIGWFTELGTSAAKADESQQQMMQTMADTATQAKADAADLKTQSDSLKDLTSKTTLTADEKTKLKDVNDEIAAKYPDLISQYDSETKSFTVNLDKLDKLIASKQKLAMQDNANSITAAKNAKDEAQAKIDADNKALAYDIKTKAASLALEKEGVSDKLGNPSVTPSLPSTSLNKKSSIDDIKSTQTALDNANKIILQGTADINDYITAQTDAGKSTKEINQDLLGLGYTQKDINSARKQGVDANKNASSSTLDLITQYNTLTSSGDSSAATQQKVTAITQQLTGTYKDLRTTTDSAGNSTIKNTDALKTHSSTLTAEANAAATATSQIKDLATVETDLGTALSKAKSNIESVNTVMATHASTGEWDYNTILTLAKAYPQLLSAMGDDKKLTEALTDVKKQQTADVEKSINDQIIAIENQVNSNLSAYGIDLKNFSSAEQAKTAIAQAEAKKRAQATIDSELTDADKKSKNGDDAAANKEAQLAKKAQTKLNSGQVPVTDADSSDAALIDQYFNEKTEKAGADKLLAATQKQADEKAQADADAKAKTAADKAKTAAEKALEGQVKDLQRAKTAANNAEEDETKRIADEKKKYDDDAEKASKLEIAQEDTIIKGYQTQLDTLTAKNALQTENNTLLKDQNDLITAQENLQSAQKEKIRIFDGEKWTWATDESAVSSARTKMADVQNTLKTEQDAIIEKAKETALSNSISAENDKKSAYATNYQNTKDAADKNYDNQTTAVSNQKTTSDRSYQAQEDALNQKKEALQGYDSGTDNATEGRHPVAENAVEVVVGNQVKDFEGGEKVLNGAKTKQLLNGTSAKTANTSNTVTSSTSPIEVNAKKVISNLDDDVSAFVDGSGKYSKDMEKNMADSVTNNKQSLRLPVTKLKNEIETEIQQFVDGSGKYSKDTTKNMGNGIDTSVESVVTPAKSLIKNVKGLITTFAQSTLADGTTMDTQLGQGIYDGEVGLTKIIDDLCTKMIDQFHKDLGIHSPSTVMHEIGGFMMKGLINGMDEADIEKFIKDKTSTMSGVFSGESANVSGSLKDWVAQAMKDTGLDPSNAAMIETIAMHESSGDPGNVNTYDINAQEGHPSKGVMQMIDESFNENKLAGHDNIMNPVDNIDSAIKYILKRYGSIANTPGIRALANGGSYVGYQTGTDNATIGKHEVAENGMELVTGRSVMDFNGGEKVYNADKTAQMLNSSASNIPSYEMNSTGAVTNPVTNHNYNIANMNFHNTNDPQIFVDQFQQLIKTM